jgi:hypothetical protein
MNHTDDSKRRNFWRIEGRKEKHTADGSKWRNDREGVAVRKILSGTAANE